MVKKLPLTLCAIPAATILIATFTLLPTFNLMVPFALAFPRETKAKLPCERNCDGQYLSRSSGTPDESPPANLSEQRFKQAPAVAILQSARHFIDIHQAQSAIPLLKRYIELKPQDPLGAFWLGLALDESGAPDKAIWSYSKSLELSNADGMDSAQLRTNIGNTLIKLNQPGDAVYNYRRAVQLEPKFAIAHFLLARALLAKGEAQEALYELEKTNQLGFTEYSLLYFKAVALHALGKENDARSQIELFLRCLPQSAACTDARCRAEKLLHSLTADNSQDSNRKGP